MVVKRPYPQLTNKMNFKPASTVVPGDLVVVDSNGKIAKAGSGVTAYNTFIGVVDYDQSYFAADGTAQFTTDDIAPVILRNAPFVAIAASPVSAGDKLAQAASGKVVTLSGTTDATLIGVALVGGTTDAEIKFVPL